MFSSINNLICYIQRGQLFSLKRKFFPTSVVKFSDVAKPPSEEVSRKMTGALSNFDKRILVFSKKYKSMAEVPTSVPVSVLHNSMSRARMRLSTYMMVLTLFGCLAYAYVGKTQSRQGLSVSQMNLDWHNEYNIQSSEEDKAKNK